jgi:hypothetical protein
VARTVDGHRRGRPSGAATLALRWGAWLFVACLVLQFFFVGLDAFEAPGFEGLHRDFAYTYGWLAPILVLLSALARAPMPVVASAVVLLVAFAIQTYLPLVASALPLIASVHAVLALAIVVVAVRLARQAGKLPDAGGTADR